MSKLLRMVFIVSLLGTLGAFGQTADLEVVSAIDSPDPVAPGAVLTYTVTLTNHGPDPATGGGLNINLPLAVTHQNSVAPAGFTCFYLGSNGTCNMPSLPVGTYVITINVVVGAHLASFPDQSIMATFFPSGTTIDPNAGNNSKTATTAVDSQQVDLSVSATDSPDPVFPDGTVTYTIDVANAGPDSASTVNFNVVPNSSLAFQSATAPAGWNCTLPAVGAQNATFTCSRATWAPQTQQFVVVFTVTDENFGINDTPFVTNFNINAGGSNETDHPDNSQNVTTQYTTPDADVSVSVTDSPDPVLQKGNITYTVQVSNSGPDAAPNTTLNVYNASGLGFVSVTEPAGWSCTEPAAGAFVQFTCTNPSLASGATSIFTVVATTDTIYYGNTEGTITTGFSAGSAISDPNNANNSDVENTAYVTPDVDMAITVTDSPDPVFQDGTITYTVQVTNNGPDPATNATMNAYNASGLGFVSVTEPAGWSCTEPAAGAFVQFSCTNPNFASGATSTFTLVATTDTIYYGNAEGTIITSFSTGSAQADPNNANNTEIESTAYVTPDADMAITVTDSPDPVFPDGTITYTVQVTNNGPDPATNATMNAYNASGLGFVSVTEPAGWSCTEPAAGAFVQFSCTNPNFASGATSTFTLVATTDTVYYGNTEGTIITSFSTGSDQADPNNANNTEIESTAYVTPDADMNITATDSPDPVSPDGDITYTVTVTNQGPDTATNAKMTVVGNGGQTRFQSISAPAGWTCAAPAPGTLLNVANFDCTNPSFASGAVAVFTVVTEASDDLHPNSDHNITQAFTTSANEADPDGTDNQVTVTTAYVVSDADMNITATDSPDPVSPDGDITYTVTVTNQGPDTATNATMTVVGNGGQTRFQSISAPAGWTCAAPAPGTVLNVANFDCTNPSFASGAVAVFTVVTEASDDLHPNSDHNITQAFATSANEADPDGTDNQVTVTTLYDVSNADLSVTNADSPDPVTSGGTITYTQSISNAGPDTATTATFNQTLPASVGFQSISAPAGWSCTTPAVGASGAINCSNASFASGATSNFTVVVTVLASSGTVTNTVTAGSSASDPDPADNSASVTTTILAPAVADLGITKTTQSDNAAPGADVLYTITLTNNGPDAATNVVVTDTLPASLLFQSISEPAGFDCTTPAAGASGTITCTAASMAAGTTATFTLIVEVAGNATGTINNTATATSDTDDNNGGNDSGGAGPVTVGGGSSDLGVTKSTNTAAASPGDPVAYTITVTNNGPDAANEVIVTDTLPPSLLFQSITPAATFTCTTPAVGTTGTITCTGGPLANGATAVFTLNTTIAPGASGSISNSVSVSSSNSDSNGGNSTATSPVLPVGEADLSITKTTNVTQVQTGNTINYTITVTNNGPESATNVIVTDDLPAGLQFISATPSQGSCTGTDPFNCNLGTLASGASATIALQALVTATSGTITNTATVDSDTDDDNLGNNTSTTPPTPVNPGASEVTGIPTLSEWALLALIAMLAMAAVLKMRM